MFTNRNGIEPFESKVWLSSPTMHGPEIEYVKDAYETNWMSTAGRNINEIERMACTAVQLDVTMQLHYHRELLHSIWR